MLWQWEQTLTWRAPSLSLWQVRWKNNEESIHVNGTTSPKGAISTHCNKHFSCYIYNVDLKTAITWQGSSFSVWPNGYCHLGGVSRGLGRGYGMVPSTALMYLKSTTWRPRYHHHHDNIRWCCLLLLLLLHPVLKCNHLKPLVPWHANLD